MFIFLVILLLLEISFLIKVLLYLGVIDSVFLIKLSFFLLMNKGFIFSFFIVVLRFLICVLIWFLVLYIFFESV